MPWPEAELQLAHATIYVATAPKSNSATKAIEAAEKAVETEQTIPVPSHLEDRHSPGVRRAGQKFDYKLPHDYPDHFVAQDYLGMNKTFYKPTEQGEEKLVKERVKNWRKQFQEARERKAPEPAVIKKPLPPGTCSTCFHSHPFKDTLICVNAEAMTKYAKPGEPYTVQSNHRCEHFKVSSR